MTAQQSAELLSLLQSMDRTMIWLGVSTCVLAIVVAFK